MDSKQLTRQEKGRIKQYLISAYRSNTIRKEDNTLCSNDIILGLISSIEDNKPLTNEDIINLKINLDGIIIYGLDNLKDTRKYISSDNILNNAYEKLIKLM